MASIQSCEICEALEDRQAAGAASSRRPRPVPSLRRRDRSSATARCPGSDAWTRSRCSRDRRAWRRGTRTLPRSSRSTPKSPRRPVRIWYRFVLFSIVRTGRKLSVPPSSQLGIRAADHDRHAGGRIVGLSGRLSCWSSHVRAPRLFSRCSELRRNRECLRLCTTARRRAVQAERAAGAGTRAASSRRRPRREGP